MGRSYARPPTNHHASFSSWRRTRIRSVISPFSITVRALRSSSPALGNRIHVASHSDSRKALRSSPCMHRIFLSRVLPSRLIRPTFPALQRRKVGSVRSSRIAASLSVKSQSRRCFTTVKNIEAASASVVTTLESRNPESIICLEAARQARTKFGSGLMPL